MLDKPNVADAAIVECLRAEFGLAAVEVTFLPLGADANAAVYQVIAQDGRPYFLKLKRGAPDEAALVVPRLLHDQGVRQVIAPLPTRAGSLWTNLDDFTVLLYPFVEGRSGFEASLSDAQWRELGVALRGVHSVAVPPPLASHLPRETGSPRWRAVVRRYLQRAETESFADPVAARLTALLRAQRDTIRALLEQAERLAAVLAGRSLPVVLCHSDIHAGNVLLRGQDDLYIVDWDQPVLAPKERDLMFIGGGVGGGWNDPRQAILFYQGYGPALVDPVALAYYRCERIVQDIAAYCDEILLTTAGDNREEGLRQLTGQFLPGDVVEVAFATLQNLPPEFRSG